MTIVLSGGLGTTTAMWEPQLATFGDAVAFDHPGHGAAPPPEGPLTVETMATQLLERLPETFSFCGLSVGGMVGMWIAANAPDRVEQLVLACTGAKLGSADVYNERAALVRAEGVAPVAEGARERWFTPGFRGSPAANRIVADLLTVSPEGYAAVAEAVGAFDFGGELGRISAPTLVIYGEEDPVATQEVADALVHGIPDSRAIAIAEASHLANVEQPDAFNEALRSIE